MAQRAASPQRVTISVEVDPELLRTVDELVAAQPDLDRQMAVEEALRLWCDHELAMAEQFAPPSNPSEGVDAGERAAWRAIQAAAAERLFRRR